MGNGQRGTLSERPETAPFALHNQTLFVGSFRPLLLIAHLMTSLVLFEASSLISRLTETQSPPLLDLLKALAKPQGLFGTGDI